MKIRHGLMAACLAMALGAHAEDAKPGVQDDWFRGKLFAPDVILKYQSQLKLTDAQRKVLRNEVTAIQSKVAALDWDIMDAGTAVQAAVDQNSIDKAAVLEKIDKVLEADARKKHVWLDMLITIKNQLTPEQIAFLKRATEETRP